MPYGNIYRPDRLYLPQEKLISFAAQVPTPFFLYNEDGIRKAARTVMGSFCRLPGHRAFFPLSANACPAILALMREEGFGALAASVSELLLAERCGFSGDRLLLHTPALTAAAIFHARRLNCAVSFDAPGQLEAMAADLPKTCLLRYYPQKPYMNPAFTSNSERNKCGMSREQILSAAARLYALGRPEIGLHCHLSDNAKDEAYYPKVMAMLRSLAAEVEEKTLSRVTCLDLGGGYGIPLLPREKPVSLPKVGALLRAQYDDAPQPAMFTELGSWIIGRHGMLVSRVVEVRERTRRYVVLDASAAALPLLLLQRHPQKISLVGSCARSGRVLCSVHGCSTNRLDRFSTKVILPPCVPGSLIALHNAGAYCESMQLRFAMQEPCGSYLYTRAGAFTASAEMRQFQ